MKTQLHFTTILLAEVNALVSALSDDDVAAITKGKLRLSLAVYQEEKLVKKLTTAGQPGKAKPVVVPPSMDEIVEKLRACSTRQEVRNLLDELPLKATELKEIVRAFDLKPKTSKADLVTQIVDIVGSKADSAAIRG